MKDLWILSAFLWILCPCEIDCQHHRGEATAWRGQNTQLDERNTYSLFRSSTGSNSYSKRSEVKGKGASYNDGSGIYKMKKRPKTKSKKEKRGMRGSSKNSRKYWKHSQPPPHPDISEEYSEDAGHVDHPSVTPPSIDPPSSMNPLLPVSPPPPMETPVSPIPSPAPSRMATTVSPTESRRAVPLEHFTLTYLFGQSDREPFDSEVSAAVSITRTYLNGFFKQRIDNLEELDTRLATVDLMPNEPFQMNFTSTAYFQPSTSSMPTEEELNLLRVLSFSGDNLLIYIGLLQSLAPDNIFSSTIDVSDSPFSGGHTDSTVGESDARSSKGGKSNAALVASVGAGTFVALLAGLAVYRHRTGGYEELEKGDKDTGVVTIAGETYMGQSTMFSTSEQRSRSADDNQSEWGISTHAHTEDAGSVTGRGSICEMEPLENQLLGVKPFDEFHSSDPLAPPKEDQSFDQNSKPVQDIVPAGSESEDDDVPLRVVDLIKMFSPMR